MDSRLNRKGTEPVGGRFARSAGYDVVSFLHGGRLLFGFAFGNRILSNRANRRLPTFN